MADADRRAMASETAREAEARRNKRWKLVVMLGESGPVDELAQQVGRLEPGLVLTIAEPSMLTLPLKMREVERRCEAWMRAHGDETN